MALNPAFESQSTRRLPFACGYVLVSGDRLLSTATVDGTLYALYILGEGEWDGYQFMALDTDMHLVDGFTGIQGVPANPPYATGILNYVHFHGGSYTIKGAGNQLVSRGPDNQYDQWFSNFPVVTPPQSFSGIAYAIFKASLANIGPGNHLVGTPLPIAPVGIFRSTRCRIFDAYGNVTGYGFTTNPAWHYVEARLRYHIKPQQPPLAGLTDAEKACFDWGSIAENAARNDYVLANGRPRFTGNYGFASDASLTNILETILRVSRSFERVYGNKIYLVGDDPRASVFLMGANHIVPGTLKLSKKDVSRAPNVFIPKYRDIDVPAVCSVQKVTSGTFSPDQPSSTRSFSLSGPSPFLKGDLVRYGGSSDPTFDGVYEVYEPPVPVGGVTGYIPNEVDVLATQNNVWQGTATGGYLGTDDARFSQRAPTNVQHRSHQKMLAMQAPGLARQPKIVPVYYDCGNSTFDQTNRLMKFERDRLLGSDTGAGWTAPKVAMLSGRLEAIDKNQAALSAVEAHDVITLDDWVTPEFAGDYEILSKTIMPDSDPSGGEGQIDLELMQYNPNAATDVSDDPGQSYATVPSAELPFGSFPLTSPAWVLQATPVGTIDPVTQLLTISTPDLAIQWVGQSAPTLYPGAKWTGLTPGGTYVLYLDDPTMSGAATYGDQVGSLPLANDPPFRVVVLYGVFNANNFVNIDLATGSAAFFSGTGTDQSTFSLPNSPASNVVNVLSWVSPQGFTGGGSHMHFIRLCGADGSRLMQLVYDDSAGTTWGGPLNFAGLTWSANASATASGSGAMQFIELTLAGGEMVCFGFGVLPSGTAIPFPAGYTIDKSILMAFPSSASDSGHPAHGVRAYVDPTGHVHHDYADGSGNTWSGPAQAMLFAWKNNMGTVAKTGGWVTIPLTTGRTFAVGGFSILDQRLSGAVPANFPQDALQHVLSGGVLPLAARLSSKTLQTIPCPNSFQINDNDAHGVNESAVDANQNVRTSFKDGIGNIWYGSSAVFALICDVPAP